MYCTSCGLALGASSRFCGTCGHRVSEQGGTSGSGQSLAQSRNDRTPLSHSDWKRHRKHRLIAVVACMVALGITATLVFSVRSSMPSEEEQQGRCVTVINALMTEAVRSAMGSVLLLDQYGTEYLRPRIGNDPAALQMLRDLLGTYMLGIGYPGTAPANQAGNVIRVGCLPNGALRESDYVQQQS
jgi:hypothetical protein